MRSIFPAIPCGCRKLVNYKYMDMNRLILAMGSLLP